jgi:hypothetical protein
VAPKISARATAPARSGAGRSPVRTP